MKSERRRQEVHLKLVQPESSQFQYQNFQSRSRLDARLWLQARLALVKAMMGEIRGMGQVKGGLCLRKMLETNDISCMNFLILPFTFLYRCTSVHHM